MSELKRKIDVAKLKLFVEALHRVPLQDVAMSRGLKPTCGTPGCHAGLIMQAAEFLPALQDVHTEICIDFSLRPDEYDYYSWGQTLSKYLLGTNPGQEINLSTWAYENPEDWGSDCPGMFFYSESFGVGNKEPLTSSVILTRWKEVLARLKAKQ